MLYVGLAYFQVGHWPQYSQPDPKEIGLEVIGGVRVGEILRILVLFAVPTCIVAVAALIISVLNDFLDSRRALRRQIAMRGLRQIGISVVGIVLFYPVLGSLANWLMD